MSGGAALVVFLVVAAVATGGMLVAARILRVRSRQPSRLRAEPYECGESPAGPAWIRFHARYYLVALFFVLFDVEAAFLIPWSTVVREAGVAGLAAVFSFVLVLMLGWLWAVRKGVLRWQ